MLGILHSSQSPSQDCSSPTLATYCVSGICLWLSGFCFWLPSDGIHYLDCALLWGEDTSVVAVEGKGRKKKKKEKKKDCKKKKEASNRLQMRIVRCQKEANKKVANEN